MEFKSGGKKAGVSLAGSSATREISSEEVLAKAKHERAARQLERTQQRGATTLQRHWRGARDRARLRASWRGRWLRRYGPLAQDATAPALSSAELAASVLPPVLLVYLPPVKSAARAALLHGGALPPGLLAEPAALRGCFALLLRSLAAADQQHNILAAAAAGAEHLLTADLSAAPAAVEQLRRLLLLCCSTVCTGGGATPSSAATTTAGDLLTSVAASRLAMLLCSAQAWKWCSAEGGSTLAGQEQREVQQVWLQRQLLAWLAPLPLLPAAARRAVAALDARQQGQQERRQLLVVLNTLVLTQLRVWQQLQQIAQRQPDAHASAAAAAAAWQLLSGLLTTPRLMQLLAAAATGAGSAAAALSDPATSVALLQAAVLPGGGREASGRHLGAADSLWLLSNLLQLVSGATASGGTHSALLRQPGVGPALAAAAQALLGVTAAGGHRVLRGAAADQALEQLWPFAEGGVTVQLLELLPLPDFCGVYHALLALADDLSTPTTASKASAGVAEQTGDASEGAGSATSATASPAGAGLGMRLLSALAFAAAPVLLPRLWRWLAAEVGLPLEAHMQATRGWEVASLTAGAAALPAQLAEPLGLFCRVYCHALAVCDDYEFHEQQPLFSLPQQRAVAAAVNTLVFRTQLPADKAQRNGSAVASSTRAVGGQRSRRMLLRYAPLLHRAMYERDARRRYCPPLLWLQPYESLIANSASAASSAAGGGPGEELTTAAVVRALVMQQHDEGSGPGAGGNPASRPAAVANILLTAPQCVPFEQRVAVFRALVAADKQRGGYELAPVDGGPRPLPLTIRRSHLLEDAIAQLGALAGGAIKRRFSVTFVSVQGYEEAGVDMGGLMKELLEGVVTAGLDQRRGLFSSTPEGFAFPNPLAERLEGGLATLTVLGMVLGRALYDGILLQAPLAPFLVARLQGRPPLFDELQALDPEVYRSLAQLKRYEGPLEDLALDFTVESEWLGVRRHEELVPGGSAIPVTAANRLQYIHLVAQHHLLKCLGATAAAFGRGLAQAIPPAWLRLFSADEVNQLLGGGEGGSIDVDDLQAHTQYSGGYSPSSTTVKLFWQVVRGLGEEDRRALLRFATSASRAPLGGFKHLAPPLTIHKVDCGAGLLAAFGGKDVDRLPTASTCHNMLKLPNFRRAGTLREKLLYAIRSGTGFELS